MKMNTEHNIEFYLSLKYPITVHQDHEGGFVAEIVDLPGCLTQAETIDELMTSINDAKQAWITTAYEMGQDIPIPAESDEYKGKFLLRLSRSLHRELAKSAELQGLSLNQYASNILAAGVHGDLLKRQVFELCDRITATDLKATHVKDIVFGYNELPLKRTELGKLEGVIYKG